MLQVGTQLVDCSLLILSKLDDPAGEGLAILLLRGCIALGSRGVVIAAARHDDMLYIKH